MPTKSPANFWEAEVLRVLETEGPEMVLRLAEDDRFDETVRTIAASAAERYVSMVADGSNADAAREMVFAEMRQEILGVRS